MNPYPGRAIFLPVVDGDCKDLGFESQRSSCDLVLVILVVKDVHCWRPWWRKHALGGESMHTVSTVLVGSNTQASTVLVAATLEHLLGLIDQQGLDALVGGIEESVLDPAGGEGTRRA